MPQLAKTTSCFIRTTSCKLVKVQKFTDMWTTGLTFREIANHYQIGAHEVTELRKRLGLPPRQQHIRYVLNDSERQRITELFNNGIPIESIAGELCIPTNVCLKRITEMGLSRERPTRGRCEGSVERDRKFIKLYRAGWSCKSIASELGLSLSRCYGIREELGLNL